MTDEIEALVKAREYLAHRIKKLNEAHQEITKDLRSNSNCCLFIFITCIMAAIQLHDE